MKSRSGHDRSQNFMHPLEINDGGGMGNQQPVIMLTIRESWEPCSGMGAQLLPAAPSWFFTNMTRIGILVIVAHSGMPRHL